MSRKLTTYRRPSILDLIGAAPDVVVLGQIREAVRVGLSTGRIDAAGKTLSAWDEALLKRVVALIRGAKSGHEASTIFNHVYLWYPDDRIREPLRALSRAVSAGMPSEAEMGGVELA